ncbi:hypothetical protein [Lentzea sp. NBRC 102530]|uniref:hypothetical protein n=1 Tax=Lentzea sp. NBRC 102530 TaxID=3032201 RepID=UPI0024A2FBA6|nr:hypothetical protein [Lentzea sp. NBRC 102530]GLY54822.1 hypothetical protein Lesp01_84770 [Lentzea sp. NBRC 102530]
MDLDPTSRLVKLISLVAFTEENTCGLRKIFSSAPELSEDLGVMAHQMCMYYAGAVRYMQTREGHENKRDYQELAEFTLPFVTNADADAEELVGKIVMSSLRLLDGTVARVIGRKWLDEVLGACWDCKLAASPDIYGKDS